MRAIIGPAALTIWCLAFVAVCAGDQAEGEKPEAKQKREHASHARALQLLKQRCNVCHGDDADDVRGDLDLRTREGMLRGGETGPAIVPGDPEQSALFVAVTWRDPDLRMPPKENDRLSEAEVELIRRWIADGAPSVATPSGEAWTGPADGIPIATSGGLTPEWTDRRYAREAVWSFFPIARPRVPESDARHPVDAFIERRLAEKQLEPAPAADRVTLLRRATLDLTGLPPSPDEIEEFLGDESPDAFERVLDRLLASPRHGERMAQHWLDVVRYADTAGFSNDFERPHAWRYRDWVVRAFNIDLPFDRFVLEQIAGDEFPSADTDSVIATGYLRMGPWEHTGMSVKAVTRQQFLDDVTNSVGVTFLGHELRCARCHDHKFDPIPTRDYYSIQAIFAAAQFDEPETPFAEWEHTGRLDDVRRRVERLSSVDVLRGDPDEKNDALTRNKKKRKKYLDNAATRHLPRSFAVKTAKPEETHVLIGGALDTPADPVSPGVLTAVVDPAASAPAEVPGAARGRRLALARWIASADNTLTARVITNRVWQWHFGRGIVATPNNLGATGSRPTHPELLDWLASRLIDRNWSLKELHRLVMTSATYRRSGDHPEPERVAEVDPSNELRAWFPPRRLTAEELRDALLFSTGELSERMGGPGSFPEINWEAALQPRHVMGGIAPAYQPSTRPDERNRRTIYCFRIRTLADPMLEVLNRPGPDVSCERRDETTVTPQVFALFNGQFAHDRAIALARRLERSAEGLDARIELAFRLLFGRAPSAIEVELCREHVEEMTAYHRAHEPVKTTLPRKVTRQMIAEQSGEIFFWEETLPLMEEYVPDLKPWDVGPETRGLAELCLVLINSNELVHVY